MSTLPFQPGEVVRVVRPNKPLNGCYGRFLDLSPDPALANVAFHKKTPALCPPDQRNYYRTQDANLRVLPLSQLEKA